VVLAGLQFASAVICKGMAWASGLPVDIAANRTFRQPAACHCVDFVRVQFLHALLLLNVIRFMFFETKNIVKQLLKKA
jgi:hypothetical protein